MWGHKKKLRKQKPRKSRLLISTLRGGIYYRIINRSKSKIAEIETAEIKECLYLNPIDCEVS